MIIDELIAVLGYDLRGEANLARFNAGLERAAMLANRMATMLVAAGTIAAGALAGLGKSVIETSAKFEGFETSLETIEGSSEKAKAAMGWITKFAAKTPYELAGVTDAFIKLKSYGIDPTDGTLETLGDTASAMNKPLNMAVEAFADATSFQFERLREFGLTATQKGDEVTFKWTKNGKEFTKVVKKNGAEIQKFLKQHWGKSFNGAMLRQSKTWNGMMSNLGDSWELFKKRIGDAGFFDHVKSKLAGVLEQIGKLDDSGTLDRWAKKLSDALTSGFDIAWKVAERLIRNLATLGSLLDAAGEKIADFLRTVSGGKIDVSSIEALALAFAALLVVLKPAWAAAIGISLAIDDFLTYMRGGDSVIGDMIEKMKSLGISFESIGATISSAAGSMGQWISSINWTEAGKNLGKTLVDGIKSALSAASSAILSVDWGALGHSIGSSIDFGAIGKAWYSALKAQFDLMGGLKEGLVEGLKNIDWAGVVSVWIGLLKGQVDLIRGVFTGITEQIHAAIKSWFEGVDWPGVGEQIKQGILAALVAIPAALIALFTGADYTQIGKAIGDGILSGLQSMGGAIKEWFASVLPAWASEFFDFKTAEDGSLKGKAREETDRRKVFEQATMPRGGDTPGLKNTLDQVKAANPDKKADRASPKENPASGDRKPSIEVVVKNTVDMVDTAKPDNQIGRRDPKEDPVVRDRRPSAKIIPIEPERRARQPASTDTLPGKTSDDMGVGAKVMSALSNVNAHLAKMSGDAAARAVNVTATDSRQDNRDQSINPNVSVSVQVQNVQEAGAKTAAAVKPAVDNALKNVPRVANKASF